MTDSEAERAAAAAAAAAGGKASDADEGSTDSDDDAAADKGSAAAAARRRAPPKLRLRVRARVSYDVRAPFSVLREKLAAALGPEAAGRIILNVPTSALPAFDPAHSAALRPVPANASPEAVAGERPLYLSWVSPSLKYKPFLDSRAPLNLPHDVALSLGERLKAAAQAEGKLPASPLEVARALLDSVPIADLRLPKTGALMLWDGATVRGRPYTAGSYKAEDSGIIQVRISAYIPKKAAAAAAAAAAGASSASASAAAPAAAFTQAQAASRDEWAAPAALHDGAAELQTVPSGLEVADSYISISKFDTLSSLK